MAKLLIVESPGKLKTLRKILGAGWDVQPSVGHITELAHDGQDSLGFDLLEDRIVCRYLPRAARGREVIQKLKAAAQRAEEIYLATDPDREGEAIAWHIAQQLKLKNPLRVVYTQITEQAVKKAISSPTTLNVDLIDAQRCRQCLDKLVGYKVSPLLWQSSGGKSAGRVQSATLHLVCEREREILAFKPQDYWSVWVEYAEGFRAFYKSVDDGVNASANTATETEDETKDTETKDADNKDEVKAPESSKVLSQEEAERLLALAKANPHLVAGTEGKATPKVPPPPFVTSSLQQSAGTMLGFAPEKTMSIAQSLYEGVELSSGPKGLITYMRTDAVDLSPEFIEEARQFLQAHDPDNLPEKTTKHRSKESAQAAHEAIRPTDISLTPDALRNYLNPEQFQLYDLIWRRALASQCAPAKLMKSRITIRSGPVTWEARGMTVAFAGYTRYWNNLEKALELPPVQKEQVLALEKSGHEKKQTQPPPRYTEPKLVQTMEKKGIGRPSTYASTLKTLKERQYLTLKGKILHPTPLGMETDTVLSQVMPDIVATRFTADMESALDAIAEGKNQWEQYLTGWNRNYLVPALDSARQTLSKQYASSPNRPARTYSKPLAKSRTACPECKQAMGKVETKKVKKGYFLKCVGDCPDLVMFWSDRTSAWERPRPKTEGADGQERPAAPPTALTAYVCPLCKKFLEQFHYVKDGQQKSLLRCSDPKARTDKKHQQVAFFQSKGRWWSPKYGELPESPPQ